MILRKLSLGLFLIALTASVLLISDWKSRRSVREAARLAENAANKVFSIAILQNVSAPIIDEGVTGMIEGLAEQGYVEGRNLTIKKFNAEGDMPTINAVARDVSDGKYDLVLTVSTPALQAVANANKAGKTKHVFALVTDPYGTGVGISRENHLDHPAYMTGAGTMQPVEASFKIARQMRPSLKTVGVVWNASEANSAAQIVIARKVCAELGIALMESTVDNSSGVAEAASALVSRGAEALWVGGDSTILVAIESLVAAARKGGVPVLTVIPPSSSRGALFDLGANYLEVGHHAGRIAAEVLGGKSPAAIPVDNFIPETLHLNKTALAGLKDTWTIPPDVEKRADVVIDDKGRHVKNAPVAVVAAKAPPLSRKRLVHIIEFIQVMDVEEAEGGIREGIVKEGLVEGRDYELKVSNAHGDMATVSSLIDAAVTDRADLIVTLSTPTLQAALRRAGDIPVVFTYCASAIAAGAGKSDTDHLPNVTGVQTTGAYEDLLKVVKECLPKAKTLGTIIVPSEVNMVYHRDKFAEAARKMGMELVAVAAETSVEIPDAAAALCQRKIDAVCQIPGNLTAAAFPGIARAAQTAQLPLFASQGSQARAGAPVVMSRDYHDAGLDCGKLVARVLRGEAPAKIPFETFSRNKLIINPAAAAACGMTIPESVKQRAAIIIRD